MSFIISRIKSHFNYFLFSEQKENQEHKDLMAILQLPCTVLPNEGSFLSPHAQRLKIT